MIQNSKPVAAHSFTTELKKHMEFPEIRYVLYIFLTKGREVKKNGLTLQVQRALAKAGPKAARINMNYDFWIIRQILCTCSKRHKTF